MKYVILKLSAPERYQGCWACIYRNWANVRAGFTRSFGMKEEKTGVKEVKMFKSEVKK